MNIFSYVIFILQVPSISGMSFNDKPVLHNKRAGSCSERYSIRYSYCTNEGEKNFNCSYSYQNWQKIEILKRYYAVVRMIGGPVCSSITDNLSDLVK